jgi:hypothetical protein
MSIFSSTGVDGTKTNGPSITTINETNQIQPWSGNTANGTGAELIRWAVNFDKWVMQEIGYNPGDGHASNNALGSNQVVCNWTDQMAINISKNHNIGTGDNAINFNNCAGDFYVIDPVNNPNGTKYEDLQGVWHDVPGATPVMGASAMPHHQMQLPGVAVSASSIRLQTPASCAWQLTIATLDGRTLR